MLNSSVHLMLGKTQQLITTATLRVQIL